MKKSTKLIRSPSSDLAKIEKHVHELIALLGENPSREGLVRTPARVAASLKFLTHGYRQDIQSILKNAVFNEPYDEMVVVKDIQIFSLCEHHMLPFYGRAHVAYIPNGKIVGLSKIPRIVEVFARRLQVQERLTSEIANCLMTALKPRGVGVVIEALHLCMAMRGVQQKTAFTTTSAMLGSFRNMDRVRAEFLSLIGGRNG
ncbi:MAG: GTP cyclohydrolase I FolE [Candidatus Omnitrophica bacterium]|nr:GTP cyclohydrolase I FolE [Candidatus Omnitrophota bacterium]